MFFESDCVDSIVGYTTYSTDSQGLKPQSPYHALKSRGLRRAKAQKVNGTRSRPPHKERRGVDKDEESRAEWKERELLKWEIRFAAAASVAIRIDIDKRKEP